MSIKRKILQSLAIIVSGLFCFGLGFGSQDATLGTNLVNENQETINAEVQDSSELETFEGNSSLIENNRLSEFSFEDDVTLHGGFAGKGGRVNLSYNGVSQGEIYLWRDDVFSTERYTYTALPAIPTGYYAGKQTSISWSYAADQEEKSKTTPNIQYSYLDPLNFRFTNVFPGFYLKVNVNINFPKASYLVKFETATNYAYGRSTSSESINIKDYGTTGVNLTLNDSFPAQIDIPVRPGYKFNGYWNNCSVQSTWESDYNGGRAAYHYGVYPDTTNAANQVYDATGKLISPRKCDIGFINSLGGGSYTLYADWIQQDIEVTLDWQEAQAKQNYPTRYIVDNPEVNKKVTITAGTRAYKAKNGVHGLGNYGPGTEAPVCLTPALNFSFDANATNQEFKGYFTEPGGQGVMYIDAGGYLTRTWDIDENPAGAGKVTLYACWGPVYTDVKLLSNYDGGDDTKTVKVEYKQKADAATAPTVDIPLRKGYVFEGYYKPAYEYTAAQQAQIAANPDAKVEGTLVFLDENKYFGNDGKLLMDWDIFESSYTLYARWTPNTYKFNFSLNGNDIDPVTISSGSLPEEDFSIVYDTAIPTIGTLPTLTRDHYTFDGWYSTKDVDTGVKYYNADGTPVQEGSPLANKKWQLDSDTGVVTLYAGWVPQTYTVTLDAGAGATTTGDTSVNVKYQEDMPSATMPTKIGYTFNGYLYDYAVQGYFKTSESKFYEEFDGTTYTNQITPTSNNVYYDISTYTVYRYDSRYYVVANDIVFGYYKSGDGCFYEDSVFTTSKKLPSKSGLTYYDLSTCKSYRYTNSTFINQIEGYYYKGVFYKEATHKNQISGMTSISYIDKSVNDDTLKAYKVVGTGADQHYELDSRIVFGYYYSSNFYKDTDHTVLITGDASKIYLDIASETLYNYSTSYTTNTSLFVDMGYYRDNKFVDSFGTLGMYANDIYVDLTNFKKSYLYIDGDYYSASTKTVTGYYYQGIMYSDAEHKNPVLNPSSDTLYIDANNSKTYRYTGSYYLDKGTTDGIISGYFSSTENKFYTSRTYGTSLSPDVCYTYYDIATDKIYYYAHDLSLIADGGVYPNSNESDSNLTQWHFHEYDKTSVTSGYVKITYDYWGLFESAKFYANYDSAANSYTNEISGEPGKLYLNLFDNKYYRWFKGWAFSGTDNERFYGNGGGFYELTYEYGVYSSDEFKTLTFSGEITPSSTKIYLNISEDNQAYRYVNSKFEKLNGAVAFGYYNGINFYSENTFADDKVMSVDKGKIYFDLTTGKEYSTPANAYTNVTFDITDGYYNIADNKFYKKYEAPNYSDQITPNEGIIYRDLLTGKTYKYSSIYYQILGDTILGYYNPSDSKFYATFDGSTTYINEIPKIANVKYVDVIEYKSFIYVTEISSFFNDVPQDVRYYDGEGNSTKKWDRGAETLEADWYVNVYNVHYDNGTGTGGPADTYVTYGDPTPTITSTPTRTGYTFDGYYDDETAGNKYYNSDLSLAVTTWDIGGVNDNNATKTLYARWKAKEYDISFDLNGKNYSVVIAKYNNADKSFYVDLEDPTTKITGNINTIYLSQTIEDTVTVYYPYRFVGDSYYLDASIIAGYYKTGDGKFYYDSAFTATEVITPSIEKTYIDLGGSNTLYRYSGSAYYTSTSDVTSSTTFPSGNKATYDANMPSILNMPTLTRVHYTLTGYYGNPNGTGTKYYNADGTPVSGSKWRTDAAAVLYAHWEPTKYTITYVLNGGMHGYASDGGHHGSNAPQEYYTFETSSLELCKPYYTESGVTFDGWYAEATFVNKVTKIEIDYNNLKDIVVYAKWIRTISWYLDEDGTLHITYNQNSIPNNAVKKETTQWDGTSAPWIDEDGENVTSEEVKKIVFDTTPSNPIKPVSTKEWFKGLDKVTEIDLDGLDTENTVDMSSMFEDMTELEEIKGLPDLDTSNVTDMSELFKNCKKLEEVDVTNFDTSKVEDMTDMFSGTDSLEEINISNFDITNITDDSKLKILDDDNWERIPEISLPVDPAKPNPSDNRLVKEAERNGRTIRYITLYMSPTDTEKIAVMDGGNASGAILYAKEHAPQDYSYDNIYEDNTFSALFNVDTSSITADKNLYVKWKTVSFPIEYNLNGGTINPDATLTYTVEDTSIKLLTPTRTGYKFLGWYEEETFVNEITEITVGTHGPSKKVYAKWEYEGGSSGGDYSGGTITKSEVSAIVAINEDGVQVKKLEGMEKDFTVEYLVNGEWTSIPPTAVGKYDVKVSYEGDAKYDAYEEIIPEGYIINAKPVSKEVVTITTEKIVVNSGDVVIDDLPEGITYEIIGDVKDEPGYYDVEIRFTVTDKYEQIPSIRTNVMVPQHEFNDSKFTAITTEGYKPGTVLNVELVEDNEEVKNKLEESFKNYEVYDVTLMLGGQIIEVDGEVELYFPLTGIKGNEDLKVYQVNGNEVKELSFSFKDRGSLILRARALGQFVFVSNEAPVVKSAWPAILIILASVIALAVGFYFVYIKFSEKEVVQLYENKLIKEEEFNNIKSKLISLGAICSKEDEQAILNANEKFGCYSSEAKVVASLPYDENVKIMTVVIETEEGLLSITKGDVKEVFNRSNGNWDLYEAYDNMKKQKLEVYAVAIKNIDKLPKDTNELEKDLTIIGLIGIKKIFHPKLILKKLKLSK